MVAIFNGVGGGAVALLAWVEFRSSGRLRRRAHLCRHLQRVRGDRRQHLVLGLGGRVRQAAGADPGQADHRRAPPDAAERPVRPAPRSAARRRSSPASHSELVFIALLVSAAVLGILLVLPIGGADMPVVISLLNAFTGLSAAATGVALDNSALIVAGMLVGASGTLLTQQMAAAMNRSVRAIVAGGFGGDDRAARGRRRRDRHGPLDHGGGRGDPARLRPAGRHRARLRPRRQPGPARAARA